jgi:tRNA(Ile)-lysidine synthase
MKEAGVKPWKRMAMPIICLNEKIVAVQLGDKLVVNEQFKDKALTPSAIKSLIEKI